MTDTTPAQTFDGRAVIKDWDGLSRVAEFDPQYLRLWKEAV